MFKNHSVGVGESGLLSPSESGTRVAESVVCLRVVFWKFNYVEYNFYIQKIQKIMIKCRIQSFSELRIIIMHVFAVCVGGFMSVDGWVGDRSDKGRR